MGDTRRNTCSRASPSDARSWCTCPVCPDSWRNWPRTAHTCCSRCLRDEMQKKKNRTLLRFHETEITIIDEYKMIFCRHTFVVAFRTLLEADCQIGDSKMSGRAGETGVLTSARANFTGFVARPADTALVREAPWRTATDTCAGRKKRHPSRCFSNDFTLRRVKRREKI